MGEWSGTVPTILAGDIPSGDDWDAVLDIESALTDDWTNYSSSFVWGASTTPPTQGASTYSAYYRRLKHTIDYTFSITIGAGFAAGSGNYRFPLPVTPATPVHHVGRVYVQDSGTAFLTGIAVFDSTADTYLSIVMANATGALLTSGGPGTPWAAGDKIQCSITYTA